MSDLFLTVPAVPCEVCDGDGIDRWNCERGFDGCSVDAPQHMLPCSDCINGLVPSPEATEAAAEANWYEWHKGHSGGFKGAMRAMARASLLAAAFTPQGATE